VSRTGCIRKRRLKKKFRVLFHCPKHFFFDWILSVLPRLQLPKGRQISYIFLIDFVPTSCRSSISSNYHLFKIYRSTRWGWVVQGYLLGCPGSAAPCIRNTGHKILNDLETHLSRFSEYSIWHVVLSSINTCGILMCWKNCFRLHQLISVEWYLWTSLLLSL